MSFGEGWEGRQRDASHPTCGAKLCEMLWKSQSLTCLNAILFQRYVLQDFFFDSCLASVIIFLKEWNIMSLKSTLLWYFSSPFARTSTVLEANSTPFTVSKMSGRCFKGTFRCREIRCDVICLVWLLELQWKRLPGHFREAFVMWAGQTLQV